MKTFWGAVTGGVIGNFLARFLTDEHVLWAILQMPWSVWILVAIFIAGLVLVAAGIVMSPLFRRRP